MKTAREIAEKEIDKYTIIGMASCSNVPIVIRDNAVKAVIKLTSKKDKQLKKAIEALKTIADDGHPLADKTLKELGVE